MQFILNSFTAQQF